MSKYLLKLLVYCFSALTFGSLFLIIGFILIKGLPHLSLSLFSWTYTSENISLMPAIISTVILVFGALLFSLAHRDFLLVFILWNIQKKILFVLKSCDWPQIPCLGFLPLFFWSVWHALLCSLLRFSILSVIRNLNLSYHGVASHYSLNRRSPFIC